MCQKGDSPALNAGQVFEFVQSTSLQRQPPPVFTYKNYKNTPILVIPKSSFENKRYISIGIVNPDKIIRGSTLIISNANL